MVRFLIVNRKLLTMIQVNTVSSKVFILSSGNKFYYFTFFIEDVKSLPHAFIADSEKNVIDCYCGKLADEKLSFYSSKSSEGVEDIDMSSFSLKSYTDKISLFSEIRTTALFRLVIQDVHDASRGDACDERRWFYRYVGCNKAYWNYNTLSYSVRQNMYRVGEPYLLLFIIGTLKYLTKDYFGRIYSGGNDIPSSFFLHEEHKFKKLKGYNGYFPTKYMTGKLKNCYVRPCIGYFRALMQSHHVPS